MYKLFIHQKSNSHKVTHGCIVSIYVSVLATESNKSAPSAWITQRENSTVIILLYQLFPPSLIV